MKYCPEHGSYRDACPGCTIKLADRVDELKLELKHVRHQAIKDVLTAIRYGDLKGPIGEQMLKSKPYQTVGGVLLMFEEWFLERFKDDLK